MDYYIAPETDIYVLSGVPLDNTYEHTIAWDYGRESRDRQARYFLSKTKYHFARCTYERTERLWCKVERKADDMYDCNYLMFKNSAFGDKWFYAFIIGVEYVNNNTSKIAFEIDVMQTWLRGINLDYNPVKCFVERSHTATDTLFEHLVPEEVVRDSDYVVDQEVSYDMGKMKVVFCVSEVPEGDGFVVPEANVISGILGVVAYIIYDLNNQADLDRIMSLIRSYIDKGKENSILSIQMIPQQFLQASSGPWSVKLTKPTPGQALGGKSSGFFPRNNKLYSYPFNRIRVNNECGSIKEYKWELFTTEGGRGIFMVDGTYAWQGGAVAYPTEYKGVSRNMEDAVTLENFPISPWASDAYRAWWAQNTATHVQAGVGLATSVLAAGVGIGTGNPYLAATGIGGAVSSLMGINASLYDAKHRSPAMHGSTNSSLMLAKMGNFRFTFTRESLRKEMLEIYDQYFTKFGYARKIVTSPPYINRERWTYVKTIGFEVNGSINNRDSKKIAEIYDKGVTFWRNGEEIGRYELSNNPL